MEKFWIAYKCSRSEILQKVVKYIEVHIMEPIHLSDAAAETGVSSAYLSTMFKKEMGYNFYRICKSPKNRTGQTNASGWKNGL